MKKTTIFDGEMNIQQIKHSNPGFYLSIRKSDLNKINPVLNRIYELIPCSKIQEDLEVLETFNVVWGTGMPLMQKGIKTFDKQYFCFWCKIYFCPECGDKVDNTKTGNDRLVHPHNMIWIGISNEDGLKEIEVYKLGRNIMYQKNCNFFTAICNGELGVS